MNNPRSKSFNPDSVEGEYNLVAMWSKPRLSRIIAGMLAGIVAAIAMELFGVIFCVVKGMDITMPMKIGGLPILGREALAFGSAKAIVVGVLAHFGLSAVLGGFYGYFTGVNKRGALFGMGITWGIYGWIFITNLFMPSFRSYYEAQIPSGTMFFAWLVFGLSLMSISIFDREK